MFKRFVVAQHERGFLFRDRQLKQVLEPRVYRYVDPLGRVQVELYDLGNAVCANPNAKVLMKTAGSLPHDHLEAVAMSDRQLGLVYRDDKFTAALAPGERAVFWRRPYALRVDRVDIDVDLKLPQVLA